MRAAVRDHLRERTRKWAGIIRLAPRGGPVALAQSLAVNITIGLMPSVFVVAMGVLLSRIVELGNAPDRASRTSELIVPFVVAIGAFVAQQTLLPLQVAYGEVVARRVDAYCIQRLMQASTKDADIATLEDPASLDVLNDARSALDRDLPAPGDAVAGALALIARYGQLVGALVLVAVVLSPAAALVLAATALTLRFGQRGSLGRIARLWYGLAGDRRAMTYVRRLGAGSAAAKEIRVLGLMPWLHGLHRRQSETFYHALWRGRWTISFRPFLVYAAVGLLGSGVVMVSFARQSAAGDLSLLAFAVGIQAVLIPMRFAAFFPECDVQTQYGLEGYHATREFEALAARGAARRASQVSQAAQAAEASPPPTGTIRFEGVHFRYAADGPEILQGLDLELRPGTSTAVVGLNGAGKTTLVKLLTRMYEPTAGRITVGGVPVAGLDMRAWQKRIAVIFQDYVRYELSAEDNIRMGAPHAGRGSIAAAVGRAGAGPVIDRLADGPATVLSSWQANGQDLSGGQWQRIALARAFYAADHGASVLVLDEPTAQLDVRAEVEFFDRFIEVTEGLTSVIISHRFSTVRRADQIVVIEHGQVVERGSHDELMAQSGRYASMFRLQAQRFEEMDR